MVEKETLYNYLILGVIAICVIAGIYIFMIKPATDKTFAQKNFEEQRSIFLARFCSGLGYINYTFVEIGSLYDGYCYKNVNDYTRIVSYFKLGWEQRDGSYSFYVLQEKR